MPNHRSLSVAIVANGNLSSLVQKFKGAFEIEIFDGENYICAACRSSSRKEQMIDFEVETFFFSGQQAEPQVTRTGDGRPRYLPDTRRWGGGAKNN